MPQPDAAHRKGVFPDLTRKTRMILIKLQHELVAIDDLLKRLFPFGKMAISQIRAASGLFFRVNGVKHRFVQPKLIRNKRILVWIALFQQHVIPLRQDLNHGPDEILPRLKRPVIHRNEFQQRRKILHPVSLSEPSEVGVELSIHKYPSMVEEPVVIILVVFHHGQFVKNRAFAVDIHIIMKWKRSFHPIFPPLNPGGIHRRRVIRAENPVACPWSQSGRMNRFWQWTANRYTFPSASPPCPQGIPGTRY